MAVVLVGGGSGAALIAKRNHDQKVERERAQAQRAQEAADQAERVAQAERDEQKALEDIERTGRRALVSDLRKAITKDARDRVAQGFLDGPIYGTQCDPIGGGNASNLDAQTGRYSCLAYNKKNADGTIEGYGFSATVNYEKFSYTWHLGNE